MEQDTGLESQAQTGPVGLTSGLHGLRGSQSQLPLSAPPDLQITGAVVRPAHITGGFLFVGRALGCRLSGRAPDQANCCKVEVSSFYLDGVFVRSCWWGLAGQRPPSWAPESPGRLAGLGPSCVLTHTCLQQKWKCQGMPLDLVCAWGAFHRGAYWKLLKEFEAEQQGVSVALCSARPSLPKELLLAGHDAAAASAFLRQTLNTSNAFKSQV